MSIAEHQNVVSTFVNGSVIQPTGHVAATGVVLMAWLGWLTPVLTAIATVMAILWYAVTLYESKTVQDMIARWKAKKVLGPKVAAQVDAAVSLVVAKQAVKDAAALPVTPADVKAAS